MIHILLIYNIIIVIKLRRHKALRSIVLGRYIYCRHKGTLKDSNVLSKAHSKLEQLKILSVLLVNDAYDTCLTFDNNTKHSLTSSLRDLIMSDAIRTGWQRCKVTAVIRSEYSRTIF